MKISSPAFENNGLIPSEYTCDGSDISPPLVISEVPEEAKSLAIIMDDPDAPMDTFTHWVVWNISPQKTQFAEGENISFPQGKTSFGSKSYGGPCPPGGTHRYFFKLYALDLVLNLREGSSKADLEKTMRGHILSEANLIGRYSRQ
jgi:Raf kinase inhibitor-like YbhB/YbcL family protein